MSKVQQTLFTIVILVAVTVLVVFILIGTAPQKQSDVRANQPPRVFASPVVVRDVQPSATAVGRLNPVRSAQLHFEISAQVQERLVEPGATVEAGQLLVRLDDSEYQIALQEAQAQLQLERAGAQRDRRLLKLARENRSLQEQEVARLQSLTAGSLISRSRLDEARQRLAQLRAEEAGLQFSVESAGSRLQLTQAALQRAQRNLDKTRLTAPFSGTVNAVHVEVGDYVTPTREAVQLVDLTTLELYVEVRGDVAAALQAGQQVSVQHEGRDLTGNIISVQRDPNPQTFTYALRIQVDDPQVQAGKLAQVRLPYNLLRSAAVIPVSALLRDSGKTFVMVVHDDRLQKRSVQLGPRLDQSHVVVRSGLTAGEWIVIRDVAALGDGLQVEVVREAPRYATEPEAAS